MRGYIRFASPPQRRAGKGAGLVDPLASWNRCASKRFKMWREFIGRGRGFGHPKPCCENLPCSLVLSCLLAFSLVHAVDSFESCFANRGLCRELSSRFESCECSLGSYSLRGPLSMSPSSLSDCLGNQGDIHWYKHIPRSQTTIHRPRSQTTGVAFKVWVFCWCHGHLMGLDLCAAQWLSRAVSHWVRALPPKQMCADKQSFSTPTHCLLTAIIPIGHILSQFQGRKKIRISHSLHSVIPAFFCIRKEMIHSSHAECSAEITPKLYPHSPLAGRGCGAAGGWMSMRLMKTS